MGIIKYCETPLSRSLRNENLESHNDEKIGFFLKKVQKCQSNQGRRKGTNMRKNATLRLSLLRVVSEMCATALRRTFAAKEETVASICFEAAASPPWKQYTVFTPSITVSCG